MIQGGKLVRPAKPFPCLPVAVQRESRNGEIGLVDHDLLAMALIGYEAQKAKLDAAIAGIQAQYSAIGHRRADLTPRFLGNAP